MFNPISTWSILLKLLELKPERKSKSIKANQQFIYRFMLRNNYSFRTYTHIGQSLPKNCFTLASIFLNNVWDKRISNGFYDAIIGNCDETPVFFNMLPNKTIAKKGGKTIIIKTQNQENCRVSVLLTVTADGGKLSPYLIFKAKNQGLIEKNLQKDEYVIKKLCFVSCNENAWSTKDIMINWYNKVWLKYLKEFHDFIEEKTGFLILDKATSHLCTSGNQEVSFIPGGMTRFYQPLDVSINKPYKAALRE